MALLREAFVTDTWTKSPRLYTKAVEFNTL